MEGFTESGACTRRSFIESDNLKQSLAERLKGQSKAVTHNPSAMRNIVFHYDSDPSFYQKFLDKDMHYSSARFDDSSITIKQDTLEAAQANKTDALIKLLAPSPQDRVVDIGCGWGAMTKALTPLVSHVLANTISPRQADYLHTWARAQPEGSVEIWAGDFSTLEGQWDAIISVEAIESIGRSRLREFFHCCSTLLKPGGRLVLQSTVQSANRVPPRRAGTWIQNNIFPGGYIPLTQELLDHALAAGLRIQRMDFLGLHYAETLRVWRERFLQASRQEAQPLCTRSIDESKWEYYFAYARGGYMDGYLDLIQAKYVKI